MADRHILAFHGWGFSGEDWEPWHKKLSNYGTFSTYNRGYFDDPLEIETKEESQSTVVITHSYGLHWVEKSLLDETDLLVVISGFLHFHPYAAQYKRRSRLVLQEMVNNLEVDPEKVLNEFYQNCYSPQDAPDRAFQVLNHQLLLDDLRQLQDSTLDAQLLKKADKICILHGTDDAIVPNKKGREIYTHVRDQSQYFEIKGAGHALPFTHEDQCLEFIIPELAMLNEVNA